jgi:DNA-binding NtrC family response regulator
MDEPKTILVVDDEAAVRILLSRSLQRCGYALLEAANGSDAIEVNRQHPGEIHVLVSDVRMPGMNGVEVAKELCIARPGLKVLLISGFHDLPPNVEKSWEFMQKPFSPSALAERIQRMLVSGDEDGEFPPRSDRALS